MAVRKQKTETGVSGVEYLAPPHTVTDQEKTDVHAQASGTEHLEQRSQLDVQNLVYADDNEEPAIHIQTWIAVFAMCVLSYVQFIALTGPPLIVSG